MFLMDYHTHTLVSPDGFAPLEDMAAAAVEAGLQELCVTDHCDLLSTDGERTLDHSWQPALEQYDRLEARRGIKVKLGVELGEAPVSPDTAAALAAMDRLDFVIGSLHNWSEEKGGRDFYYTAFHSAEQCREAVEDYLDSMERLVELPGCYDVLGHVNYPLRYMARDGFPMTLTPWLGRLREIFRAAVESGRGIEVNTNRGAALGEWEPILALYRECGGEIVTLGSDAHKPDAVGKGIRDACALVKDAGLRYVTTFTRRKPEFHKL